MKYKYKIKARFIGKHGSIGYQKGKYYNLIVIKFINNPRGLLQRFCQWLFKRNNSGGLLCIQSPIYCPYKNWQTFKGNWKIIEKVKSKF